MVDAREKKVPHYSLEAVKDAVSQGRWDITATANQNLHQLGGDESDVVDIVLSLERVHFYKSMPSKGDHRVWQDVYHPKWRGKTLYFKVTEDERGYLVLSFKEK